MQNLNTMEVTAIITAVANIVVAGGIIFVWKQLGLLRRQFYDDHERSRKQTLIEVMREWNKEIGPETAAAQKLVANLDDETCRKIANMQPAQLPKNCLPLASATFKGDLKLASEQSAESLLELGAEHSAHLRFLAVEYLNVLETSLSAWRLGIVDLETMEDEFSFLIDNSLTDPALTTFRRVLGNRDGFPSLVAFLSHVETKSAAKSTPDNQLGQN